jgi:anti-sigma regulatory factor (Ser/Thr protein kinase)
VSQPEQATGTDTVAVAGPEPVATGTACPQSTDASPSSPGELLASAGRKSLDSGLASAEYVPLPALLSAPLLARRQTRRVLRRWRIQPDIIETALLLVSELVTNALKFARPEPRSQNPEIPGADDISLTLRHLGQLLRIEVSDPGLRAPTLSEAECDDEGGRGLILIAALSSGWWYYFPPSGGKVVCCTLRMTGTRHDAAPPQHQPSTARTLITAPEAREERTGRCQ